MEFDDKTIQSVWEKARALPDKDSTEWRKDECGAWIRRDQYANPLSEFGWKIESVIPGKTVSVDDLRPYQHANSFDRAAGRTHCRVKADRTGLPPTAVSDTPHNTSGG